MPSYSTQITTNNNIQFIGDLTVYSIAKDWWLSEDKNTLSALNKQLPITVSLKGLTRIDSAGLAWLINIVRDSKSEGFEVFFTHITDELTNLAKISDVSTLLSVQ
jgi:phospholipid transport system transporter-binding protein